MSEPLITRDQRYAAVIYGQVNEVPKQEQETYGRLANRLPVLVKKDGLAQALSFAEAKGEAGGKRLLKDLHAAINEISGRQINLMERSRKAELSEYLWLTQQVMTALHWYKRFAQSVLEVKNDG
jgi:CRISPR-associated protein Cmr5